MYNRFLEVAGEGKNEWWRYLLGSFIVFLGYFFGSIPFAVLAAWGTQQGYIENGDPDVGRKVMDPSVMHLPPYVILLLQIGIFVFAMLALWAVVRFLHQRKFLSIVTSRSRLHVRRIGFAFITYIGLMTALLTIQMNADPTNYETIFRLEPFLVTLAIGLFLLPVQTWWEEFFFRGYLLQGLGLAMRNPLGPLLITSLVFGLMHMSNTEAQTYGMALMLPQYILPGLMLGLLTVLDEGQELAMGAHWANNLFLICVVTNSKFSIQAPAIYASRKFDPITELWTSAVLWLIFLGIMWATYKWDPKRLYKSEKR